MVIYRGVNSQTDNSHVASKVALRVEAVRRLGEPRQILVMDAYHGHGVLWDQVQAELGRDWNVRIYAVDHEQRSAGTLRIDNVRLLQSIDLTGFDLFDLDAYGWPAAQLKAVATKAPDKMVVLTRISPQWARIPLMVTDDLGLVLPHGSRHPGGPGTVLVSRLAEEMWEAWLYLLGYRTSRLLTFEDYTGDSASMATKRFEIVIPDGFPTPAEFVALDA